MFRRAFLGAAIILAFSACEKEPAALAQLITDRDSLGFGGEFGSGAYVGTSIANTLIVTNEGLETLTISSVTVTGRPPFALGDVSTQTLETYDRAFIQVLFEPTAPGDFQGMLTLESNAENFPIKEIPLSGRGVAAP
ncbi:MAG: hypothetical protein M3Y59_11585 [Myxococcota bacterium]|nr:hypothetical protein [Myxococcota bacterium]